MGIKIRCTSVQYGVLSKLALDSEGKRAITGTGFLLEVLKELEKSLNFTTEVVLSVDGQFGSKNAENGSWNGMVGMVNRSEADLIVAPLTQGCTIMILTLKAC